MAGTGQTNNRNRTQSSGSRSTGNTQSRSTSRSSSARSNSTGKKSNTNSRTHTSQKSQSSAREESEYSITDELIVIGMIALVIFLFLCTIKVISSKDPEHLNLGDYIRLFMLGVMGITAYIAPVLTFICVALGISNRNNKKVYIKITAIALLVSVFGILAHVISYPDIVEIGKEKDWFSQFYKGYKGGGVLFGSISLLLCKLIGKVGTILVSIAISIAAFIMLTGKSLIRLIQAGTDNLSEKTKEYNENQEEQRKIRKEIREQQAAERRMDRKEKGVTLNTFIKPVKVEQKMEPGKDDAGNQTLEPIADNNIQSVETEPEEQSPSKKYENYHWMTDSLNTKASFSDTSSALKPKGGAAQPEEIKTSGKKTESNDIHRVVADFDPTETENDDSWIQPVNTEAENDDSLNAVMNDSMEEVRNESVSDYDLTDSEEENSYIPDTNGQNTESIEEERNIPSENNESKVVHLRSRDKSQIDFTKAKPVEVKKTPKEYHFPPVSLLHKPDNRNNGDDTESLKATAKRLEETLETFGVRVKVTDFSKGPAVTRYELHPEQGVKVSKILSLSDDIKLNLAAADIRIEAPIPGKMAVGIEVPNKSCAAVAFRELLEKDEFKKFDSNLAFAVGKDIAGQMVIADIGKMPHVLIAGATGSGKSVCINTLIMSILYKAHPDDVKLIMIDPKVVELSVYNGIPHLMIPVVTDPKKASAALQWGVNEMTERYKKFADVGCRDLKGYNKKVEEYKGKPEGEIHKKMPLIVIIVDELADLMMVASKEVEESICRLAQLARAAGIHLVIATQRPSVDVITGLIKANMPSRIAFSVSSGVDSRTILDTNGAEKLLGKGDMLFFPQGYTKPTRVQGAFVTDSEVASVVDFIKNQEIGNDYTARIEESIKNVSQTGEDSSDASDYDEYFAQAGKFVIEKDKGSIGMLQRVFKIGFNRAARIMDQLEEAGVVGAEEGTKPRKILMTLEQFENYLSEN